MAGCGSAVTRAVTAWSGIALAVCVHRGLLRFRTGSHKATSDLPYIVVYEIVSERNELIATGVFHGHREIQDHKNGEDRDGEIA